MAILTAQAGLQASGPSWVTVLEPAYPLGPRFAGPRQGLARDSAPFDPPDARAPAEFAGGGLAPHPSCRCVLSRAPHEGHMAAGSCWGRLRGRGLGEAARGLVGQINGELAEDTRAKSALRTALQAHRGKPRNVDPKALAA